MLPQLISRLQGSSKREAPESYRAVERRNGRIARLLATHFGVEKRQFLYHKPSPSAEPWSMVVNDLRYIPDGVQSYVKASMKNEILREPLIRCKPRGQLD